MDILGIGSKVDIHSAISALNEGEKYFKALTTSVCKLLNVKSVSTGPQGVPASKTIASVGMLREFLIRLRDTFQIYNSRYMEDFNTSSVLTLANENLHSLLRLGTDTPTVLDCARHCCRATHEIIKKQCHTNFTTSQQRRRHTISSRQQKCHLKNCQVFHMRS